MKNPWYRTLALILGLTAVLVVTGRFLYLVRDTLPPFAIAFVIAWMLDPLLNWVEARRCPRVLAISGVYIIAIAALAVGLLFLIPAVADQFRQLSEDIPSYIQHFGQFAVNFMKKHHSALAQINAPTSMNDILTRYGDKLQGAASTTMNVITTFLVTNLPKALWIVLIPLISFYFMNDLDRMRKRSAMFIPEIIRPKTVEMFSRVGHVFSNYIRGLTIVSLFYGTVMTIVLAAFGLKYSLIVGLISGILYAIPYFGPFVTTMIVFLVGLATFPHGFVHSAIVAASVLVVNQIFDMLISPRILGKSVGLHPVISIFALTAGGSLFGLVGMLIAVPVAACIQEIVLEFYPGLKADIVDEPIEETPVEKAKKPSPDASKA